MSIDVLVRIGSFVGLMAIFLLWETLRPLRPAPSRRWHLKGVHFFMAFFSQGVWRLILPFTPVLAAIWAEETGWGLFQGWKASYWVQVPVWILIQDLVIYWQHRIFHMKLLWPIHRMHHIDPHLDFSTGLRFHPLEIWISLALKVGVVLALGIPPEAVIAFEVILNGLAMFNHSNVALPKKLEPAIRFAVVTPEMHRVHHSPDSSEHHRNFGFNLSVWDHLFRSYRKQSRYGDATIPYGVPGFESPQYQKLLLLLAHPFK